MRKIITVVLLVCVVLLLALGAFGIAGYTIPGLTDILICVVMAAFIVNGICDIKDGKEKTMPIILISVSSLALVLNVVTIILECMGL